MWYHRDSNLGHTDFQSVALPTELWYRLSERKHTQQFDFARALSATFWTQEGRFTAGRKGRFTTHRIGLGRIICGFGRDDEWIHEKLTNGCIGILYDENLREC